MATNRSAARRPEKPEFETIWLRFTDGARLFPAPVADDRTLDQFLDLRDMVYRIIQEPTFVRDLDTALSFPLSASRQEMPVGVRDSLRGALLEELKACTRAGEVLQSTETSLSSGEDGRRNRERSCPSCP